MQLSGSLPKSHSNPRLEKIISVLEMFSAVKKIIREEDASSILTYVCQEIAQMPNTDLKASLPTEHFQLEDELHCCNFILKFLNINCK